MKTPGTSQCPYYHRFSLVFVFGDAVTMTSHKSDACCWIRDQCSLSECQVILDHPGCRVELLVRLTIPQISNRFFIMIKTIFFVRDFFLTRYDHIVCKNNHSGGSRSAQHLHPYLRLLFPQNEHFHPSDPVDLAESSDIHTYCVANKICLKLPKTSIFVTFSI